MSEYTSIVSEMIGILTSGIQEFASGFGNGLQQIVKNLFLHTVGEGSNATTTLSAFGAVAVAFGAISLAIGLCRLIFRWIGSLGGKGV